MDSNNPNFEIIYKEDTAETGSIDDCKKFLEGPSELKVLHMNVRGIISKHSQISIILDQLNDFDCLFLSETHHSVDMNLEPFSFQNYQIYGTRYHSRRTDGVITLVKKEIHHSIEENKMTDCNCQVIKFEKNKKSYLCFVIYRSPSGKINQFLLDLRHVLQKYQSQSNNRVKLIMGDININIIELKCKKVNEYLNLLTEFGFTSLLNKPTREVGNSKTCLDHVFAGPRLSDHYKTFIIQTSISDHYTTILKIDKPQHSQTSCSIYSQYHTLITENLLKDLHTESWEDIYKEDNPEVSTTLFINKLRGLIEKHTDKKNKKIVKKRTPWITPGLITSIKRRDKIHIQCKKEPMNKRLHEFYKKYRNKLNTLINKQKTEYLKNEIKNAGNNKKKIWSIANDITFYKGPRTHGPSKIIVEDRELRIDTHAVDIANAFNSHYSLVGVNASSVGTNIPSSNHDGQYNLNPDIMNALEANHCMYLNKITSKEIEKIIIKMKGGTAPGYDGITTKTLKDTMTYITKPLAYIFNSCIKKGIFPSAFKKTIVSPIFKKGAKKPNS